MAKRLALQLAGLLALSAPSTSAFAQASLLVWPIDPVIRADRGAGALWLENKGKSVAVIQIRIFAWSQQNGDDAYSEQSPVTVSPPMAQIAPGGRQMVRLMSPQGSRAPAETAYRIIVDEIPARVIEEPVAGGSSPGKAGVRFQMRYTIPLFVYGAGSSPSAQQGAASLRCALEERDGRKVLTIRNASPLHVRLVDLRSDGASGPLSLPDGQLSYVLAGASRSWALPAGATGREPVSALVNDNIARASLPGCAHE
jgi:fimbrial chaperone protein